MSNTTYVATTHDDTTYAATIGISNTILSTTTMPTTTTSFPKKLEIKFASKEKRASVKLNGRINKKTLLLFKDY